MIRFVRSVLGLCLCGSLAGQTLKFEVATVKLTASGTSTALRGGPGTRDPGQIDYTAAPLQMLLYRAWKLTSQQLSGPASMAASKYDIVAKVPPGATRDDLNVMIQNLLVERLGLAFHNEMRELPIYELVVAKGGIKMRPAEAYRDVPPSSDPALTLSGGGAAPTYLMRDKDGTPQLPPGRKSQVLIPFSGHIRLMARMQEMTDIVQVIRSQCDCEIVVDKTGLRGVYDFTLEYSRTSGSAPVLPGELAGASDPAAGFMEAIVPYLGLQLVPKKAPIQVMVVDSFHKEPLAN
jgi:uncharacterized protein (TIGR03435 family)